MFLVVFLISISLWTFYEILKAHVLFLVQHQLVSSGLGCMLHVMHAYWHEVCVFVCVFASSMLHRLTSEGAMQKCAFKGCTETAVSLLTESDAAHSLTGFEKSEREDARRRDR